MPDLALLVSCEHAVNTVPQAWRSLFKEGAEILGSHRAYDAGALELARSLASALSAPCFDARVTRLLVDHNRSPHNRALWSDFSRGLSPLDKASLLNEYYRPFREKTANWIAGRYADGKKILHLSVHTFTPVLDGRVRGVDIGILYDPRRRSELLCGREWRDRLAKSLPALRIRLNQPYQGRSDSHLTTYRKCYDDNVYLGIELELNQRLVDGKNSWPGSQNQITDSLIDSIADLISDE